ncbi:MAG: GGDEF domain-containing protein [Acidimicrobiales bacterium]
MHSQGWQTDTHGSERRDEEIERTRRAGTALSVAMIDLDAFKALNGRHGHEAGDRLLQEIAGSWQVAVRGGGDFLARLGGNEFRLLAPGSDSIGAHHLAKRLGDVRPESVGFSIGMATWDGDETARNLVRRADQAMYREKLGRRDPR